MSKGIAVLETDILTWSRTVFDDALRAAVRSLPPSFARVAGYHFGWLDAAGSPAEANQGRAIRPTLALLSAEAVRGVADDAIPAAVAVELVHNFSLLHDDVLDGDETRRHRPTAWTVFGTGPAILTGDALLTLAFDVLATGGGPLAMPAMRELGAAVLQLQEGQNADVSFERRADVDLHECVSMSNGKTGALLGCACAIGAHFGGGTADQVSHLRQFGERLGLAFQLVDDMLGIWGDPEITGKPVFSDLLAHKKSLPVVVALNSGTSAGRQLAELYCRDESLSDADLAFAADLVDLAGGRTWARIQADQQLARAMHHLSAVDAESHAATELAALARLATFRDR
ncbi:family 2 encapsulin nanocompartment cargo protein polyprenyl transferase [Amycolatopsis xylanica]|uniref:family 2 encapsulin nanocompartment cargo protein polyprenyl transferase n=1 Tax=Amycolatopsis xylanica TaxID=589385 RepID=UPI000B835861|nr:family 2 encapsulin nanocompartment cargo protein polyprenyl transferase [Amycolatopsis xylanica]